MQGALDTRAKLASPARKEDEERDEKSSQKLIGRLDRPHQQLFQQHRSNSVVPVMSAARPLFLRKRTSIRDLAMSHSCHERTHALQQARRLVGYSITSSAPTSSLRGTLRPSAGAVLQLINRRNFDANAIGSSPGSAPSRHRSASAD